jgi:hypothetical protein
MAVAFGSSSTLAEGTRSNSSYTAPAGLWHFEFLAAAGAPAATPPSGFAAVPGATWPAALTIGGNGFSQDFWYKIASSESGNYATTHASCTTRGMIACVTGNDTGTPFIPNPTQGSNPFSTSGTTTTFTGLTTTVNSELILCFASDDNDAGANLTAPAGTTPTFTEQVDDNHGNYLCTGVLSPAGATGNKTMTNNSTGGVGFFSSMVAVQPLTGAAAVVVAAPRRMPLSL